MAEDGFHFKVDYVTDLIVVNTTKTELVQSYLLFTTRKYSLNIFCVVVVAFYGDLS